MRRVRSRPPFNGLMKTRNSLTGGRSRRARWTRSGTKPRGSGSRTSPQPSTASRSCWALTLSRTRSRRTRRRPLTTSRCGASLATRHWSWGHGLPVRAGRRHREATMTDSIKAWIEERREVQRAARGESEFEQTLDSVRMFPRALDALNKVLELHVKGYETAGAHWCSECETKWPCPTVQAIEGAINE